MSELVGRRLGEFVVREPLSSGGFGEVYRAEQPGLGREAVIKVLHQKLRRSENVLARFLREAKLASRLDHPYAAHIYAFGAEPDGLMWIAMELVRGTPLDRLLAASGPIALERFAPLLERICQVVQTAHDQGIVHRDLKPANVMVLVRAGQLLPKLLDLGIAKLDEDPGTSTEMPLADLAADDSGAFAETATPTGREDVGRLTEEGAVMGSPLYMAPEQWTNASSVDARTDIYALGVLSYEALTGAAPFSGANRYAIAMAHAQKPPPPLGGKLPVALDEVLARAMAKRAKDRFATALELAAAFRTASGLADEPVGIPRLDDGIRIHGLARLPQPLAQCVAVIDGARNVHQARDAIWQLVRVSARLVGIIALAAHSHVGDAHSSEGTVTEALRMLRKRALPDADWLALARELCAPFKEIRAAYPLPELLELVEDPVSPLAALIALRDGEPASTQPQVQALVEAAMPIAERLLSALEFLGAYQLVVPTETEVELWMGVGRGEAARELSRGTKLEAWQPAIVDPQGLPVVSLWPFVQVHEPSPGVRPHLFFLEGKGRRGARLVALPDAFEHEDEGLWEALGALVRDPDSTGRTSDEEVCPYPGLSAFTANDATRFFGRERETEGFVNRLRAQPLLAVVGPSGAGKSSFVQAGVLPALPEDWRVVVVRPGASPLVSLAARLRVDLAALGSLGEVLRARGGTTVIVVDQLEELFTLCEDASERDRFAEAIVHAARSVDDPVRVVLTLRDDFLLAAEALPALRSRLAPALHLLTSPGADELQRILVEPLRQAGYELDDPKLATDVVEGLRDARSPLALLSFTGSMLWEKRDRRFRQITRKAYTSLGGVAGALAQHAEDMFERMVPEEQRLVREVFRHAVTADGTRAVLGRDELSQVLGGGSYATTVLAKLVGARLFAVQEAPTGGDQVEITHEALIDAWPRLVTWRREDAEGARLRGQLRSAARQWDERGRSPGLLWRGDALVEYRLWRSRFPGALADLETAFAEASLADAQRVSRRRRTTIAIAFAVLAAGVLGLLLLNTRITAQRGELRDNLAQQFEDQGRRLVVEGDAPLGLAYLTRAAELGAGGKAHDLLIGFAARKLASEERRLVSGNSVVRAEWSADGARLVTCGYDNRATIWNVATGEKRGELLHGALVSRLAISPDGRTIATVSKDLTGAIWDGATGARRLTLAIGVASQGVIYAPDGAAVLVIGADDTAAIWDATTGARRSVLQPEAHAEADILSGTPGAFSPDGAIVAVGDNRGTIRTWDARTGAPLITIDAHRAQVNTLAFSPDGALIASASNDGTARLIDAKTGAIVRTLPHRDRVNTAVFSPDGARVATASNDRTAVLWNVATGALERSLVGHASGVNAVAFRRDGAQVATIADDGSALLWNTTTGRREAVLVGHGGPINGVAYAPDGARLATAGEDGTAIVWSTAPQQPVRTLLGHVGIAYSAEISPRGDRVVSAGQDGTTRLWDRASGASLRVWSAVGIARRAVFSPDGTRVASTGSDALIHVWTTDTGAVVATLRGHAANIVDLAWSPDGSWLASASDDGTARAWPLAGARPPTVFRGHGGKAVLSVSFAPDSRTVLSTADDRETRRWDVASGEERDHWPDDHIFTSALDPTGSWVLGSTLQSTAKIWRAGGAREVVAELIGHAGTVYTSRWSPDGAFAVSSSIDGTARIWDPMHGDLLTVFANDDQAQMFSASYAPDGRAVITGASNGAVTIWDLPENSRDLPHILRCQVPYELRGDRMVHNPAQADCTSRTP